MNQPIVIPKWWINLAKSLLVVTSGIVVIGLFSLWATKSEFLGKYDLAHALRFGSYFIFSWYASIGIFLLTPLVALTGLFLKYPIRLFVLTLVIALLPTLFFDISR